MKDNYIKEHKHKEGSFVLGKEGDEWQMFRNGKYFSSEEKFTHLMACAGKDKTESNETLKKRVVAIIKGTIHSSVTSMNKLAEKAGFEDFNITYDEMVELLKSNFERID